MPQLKTINRHTISDFLSNLLFFGVLIYLLDHNITLFFLTVILGLIFFLYRLWRVEHSFRSDPQIILPVFQVTERTNHFMLHYLFPGLLYLSVCSYMFFSRNLVVELLISSMFCIGRQVIFTNLKAFFNNKYLIEIQTHYIYDLVSLSSYLLFILSIFEITNYYGWHTSFVFIFNLFIGFCYFGSTILRYTSKFKWLLIGLFTLFNAAIVLLLTYFSFNIIRIAAAQMYIFYLLHIYLHHLNESRSLRIRLFFEYLLIGMLLLLIGYNI